MPALNEEKNIISAIESTVLAFEEFKAEGEIVVINDGSTDHTPNLVKEAIEKYPGLVRMITHESPEGVGASFWDGVDNARKGAVCMLPGDNENDPAEIIRYLNLLENVDMVIPFVVNKAVRSRARNLLSYVYRTIINTTFWTSLNYTNGTVIYRKSLLKDLDYRVNSFVFQTDILIRLIKRGYLYAEVPYFLRGRKAGRSKACSFRSLCQVTGGYLRLVRKIYFPEGKPKPGFASDSVSARRYG